MGVTNTISRAELAAIAAAVIHGYSHIATDSLTSLHQIKKELSHPNLHRHHIQGDVLQSIAKAIRQSPSPIHFFKVNPMPVLLVMSLLTHLLKSQPPPTPTLQTPPSEQQALREIPSTTITGLQNDIENQTQTHHHTHQGCCTTPYFQNDTIYTVRYTPYCSFYRIIRYEQKYGAKPYSSVPPYSTFWP